MKRLAVVIMILLGLCSAATADEISRQTVRTKIESELFSIDSSRDLFKVKTSTQVGIKALLLNALANLEIA